MNTEMAGELVDDSFDQRRRISEVRSILSSNDTTDTAPVSREVRRSTEAFDPIRSLHDEHRLILRAIDVLDGWVHAVEQQRDPERSDLKALVSFLTDFVEAIHHQKEEDILLPALVGAGVDWNGPMLMELRLEHEQERYLVDVIRHLAHQSADWSSYSRMHFVSIARELVMLQRKHILAESTRVYPLVRKKLSALSQGKLFQDLCRFDCQVLRDYQGSHHLLGRLSASEPQPALLVLQVMRGPVLAISPEMPVAEARALAEEHGLHHLPVCLRQRLVGVTCSCELRAAAPAATVGSVMRAPAPAVEPETSLLDAMRCMAEANLDWVLVTQADEVLGSVARSDLERAALQWMSGDGERPSRLFQSYW